MCCSRISNKKVIRLHDRCLKVINDDKPSSFDEFLEKDSSVSIHEKKIQILATKIYKVSKGTSPPQITELFARIHEHPYNLRHNAQFLQPFVNPVHCGTKNISYLGLKIWNMVSDTYENIDSLYNFKKVIKNGKLKTVHTEFVRFLSKIYYFVKLIELLCCLGEWFCFLSYILKFKFQNVFIR